MNNNAPQQERALQMHQSLTQMARDRGLDVMTIYQIMADAMQEAYGATPEAPSSFKIVIETSDLSFHVVSYDEGPEGRKYPLPGGLTRTGADIFNRILKDRVAAAEKEATTYAFEHRVGTIVDGIVRSVSDSHCVVEVDGVAGELHRREQIPGEVLEAGDVTRALLMEVSHRRDLPLRLSRSSRDLVYVLLCEGVQEIADGSVEVLELDREAGRRTKIVVGASDDKVRDAAAAVIGVNGVKVNSIQDELGGERIDVCSWYPDAKDYIAELLDVETSQVRLQAASEADTDEARVGENGETVEVLGYASVSVPSEEMGRVLGTRGSNVRMAERISGYKIHLEPR